MIDNCYWYYTKRTSKSIEMVVTVDNYWDKWEIILYNILSIQILINYQSSFLTEARILIYNDNLYKDTLYSSKKESYFVSRVKLFCVKGFICLIPYKKTEHIVPNFYRNSKLKLDLSPSIKTGVIYLVGNPLKIMKNVFYFV